MIFLNGCLHSGHTGFTLDHSTKQTKQNWWKQLSVNALFSSSLRQIEQLLSGEAGRCSDSPFSFFSGVSFFSGEDFGLFLVDD